MISKKEIEHIAKLARLKLTKDELSKMEKELSKILDYVKRLKKIKLKEEKVIVSNFSFSKRKDEEAFLLDFEKEKILDAVFEKKGKFFKVPKII